MHTQEELKNGVYFWKEGNKSLGWLSQWYYCPFKDDKDDKIVYKSAEHYMMYHKAVLFGDAEVAAEILDAGHPREVKALGRKVRNFDDAKWTAERERIVQNGTLLKFTNAITEEGFRQGTCAKDDAPLLEGSLKDMLLATGDKLIVEASPFDRIWGVGFSPSKAAINYEKWGLNLLGKALMAVRTILKERDQ